MDSEQQKELYERLATIIGALPSDAQKQEFLKLLQYLMNNQGVAEVWDTVRRFRRQHKEG